MVIIMTIIVRSGRECRMIMTDNRRWVQTRQGNRDKRSSDKILTPTKGLIFPLSYRNPTPNKPSRPWRKVNSLGEGLNNINSKKFVLGNHLIRSTYCCGCFIFATLHIWGIIQVYPTYCSSGNENKTHHLLGLFYVVLSLRSVSWAVSDTLKLLSR